MPPEEYVDPTDAAAVAAVLAGVVRTRGTGGLADLLARLPGVRVERGRPGRFLSRGMPTLVWVGPQDALVLGDPVEHRQVVGGVALHRSVLTPAELPAAVAALIVALTRAQASHEDAVAVLAAARKAVQGF